MYLIFRLIIVSGMGNTFYDIKVQSYELYCVMNKKILVQRKTSNKIF